MYSETSEETNIEAVGYQIFCNTSEHIQAGKDIIHVVICTSLGIWPGETLGRQLLKAKPLTK